jgi:hypothetical protein
MLLGIKTLFQLTTMSVPTGGTELVRPSDVSFIPKRTINKRGKIRAREGIQVEGRDF